MENVASEDWYQRDVRSAEETRNRGHCQQRRNTWAISDVAQSVDQIAPQRPPIFYGVYILRCFFKVDHPQRHNHGDKRKSIEIEAANQAKELETKSGEHRAHDSRKLKLRGIQRDGVCQVFSTHQIKSHRLIRRASQRHAATGNKGKR